MLIDLTLFLHPRCSGTDLEILGQGFPYHSQWSSNFTVIFDGNSRFLPSIDLEKFYGQLIKNFEMEEVLGTPDIPLKLPLVFLFSIRIT